MMLVEDPSDKQTSEAENSLELAQDPDQMQNTLSDLARTIAVGLFTAVSSALAFILFELMRSLFTSE